MRKKRWQKNRVGLISKTFFYRIFHGAKIRNLEFDLTMEYIWDLYEKQNGKCALSGIPIEFGLEGPHDRKNVSLDRIDSSLGYIEGNVWWVDKDINLIKADLKLDEFIETCNKIANHNSNHPA